MFTFMSDILHANLQNAKNLVWDKTAGHEFATMAPENKAGRQEAERKFFLTNFKAHSGLDVNWGYFEVLLGKNIDVQKWYSFAKAAWIFEITKAEIYYGLEMSPSEIQEVEQVADQAIKLRQEHTDGVKKIMEEARQKVNALNDEYKIKVNGLPKQGNIRFVRERNLSAQDELSVAKTTDHVSKRQLIQLKVLEIKKVILQNWRYEKGIKDIPKPERVYTWDDIFF